MTENRFNHYCISCVKPVAEKEKFCSECGYEHYPLKDEKHRIGLLFLDHLKDKGLYLLDLFDAYKSGNNDYLLSIDWSQWKREEISLINDAETFYRHVVTKKLTSNQSALGFSPSKNLGKQAELFNRLCKTILEVLSHDIDSAFKETQFLDLEYELIKSKFYLTDVMKHWFNTERFFLNSNWLQLKSVRDRVEEWKKTKFPKIETLKSRNAIDHDALNIIAKNAYIPNLRTVAARLAAFETPLPLRSDFEEIISVIPDKDDEEIFVKLHRNCIFNETIVQCFSWKTQRNLIKVEGSKTVFGLFNTKQIASEYRKLAGLDSELDTWLFIMGEHTDTEMGVEFVPTDVLEKPDVKLSLALAQKDKKTVVQLIQSNSTYQNFLANHIPGGIQKVRSLVHASKVLTNKDLDEAIQLVHRLEVNKELYNLKLKKKSMQRLLHHFIINQTVNEHLFTQRVYDKNKVQRYLFNQLLTHPNKWMDINTSVVQCIKDSHSLLEFWNNKSISITAELMNSIASISEQEDAFEQFFMHMKHGNTDVQVNIELAALKQIASAFESRKMHIHTFVNFLNFTANSGVHENGISVLHFLNLLVNLKANEKVTEAKAWEVLTTCFNNPKVVSSFVAAARDDQPLSKALFEWIIRKGGRWGREQNTIYHALENGKSMYPIFQESEYPELSDLALEVIRNQYLPKGMKALVLEILHHSFGFQRSDAWHRLLNQLQTEMHMIDDENLYAFVEQYRPKVEAPAIEANNATPAKDITKGIETYAETLVNEANKEMEDQVAQIQLQFAQQVPTLPPNQIESAAQKMEQEMSQVIAIFNAKNEAILAFKQLILDNVAK